MKLKIVDIPFNEKLDLSRREFGPPPPPELGKNLQNLDDAKRWLLHPSNWHDSRVFILKWDGLVPTLSRYHGERLLREEWDTGILEVAVRHQYALKNRVRRGESIAESDPLLDE